MRLLATPDDDTSPRSAARPRPVFPSPTQCPTLTVEEAAVFLGISRGSAYEAARTGVLPVLRVGRRFLVSTARLATLLGLDLQHIHNADAKGTAS